MTCRDLSGRVDERLVERCVLQTVSDREARDPLVAVAGTTRLNAADDHVVRERYADPRPALSGVGSPAARRRRCHQTSSTVVKVTNIITDTGRSLHVRFVLFILN